MKLYRLGERPWMETQLVYHALASLGEPAVVTQRPAETYVSLGRFNTPGELDLDFLEREGIPSFRREIGGGTVLLDRDQVFYHVVADVREPGVPARVDRFYRYALEPVMETYCDFGLDAGYRPANDLVVDGRKISGNGAGSFGNHYVLSGSVLLDFDTDLMTKTLDMPGDRFRRRAARLMEQRLTTLRDEVGDASYGEVRDALVERFRDAYGELEPAELTDEVRGEMERLRERYRSEEWLSMAGKQPRLRDLKIAEGCYLAHAAADGLEVVAQRSDDEVTWVRALRDGERDEELETALTGAPLITEEVLPSLPENLDEEVAQNVADRVVGDCT